MSKFRHDDAFPSPSFTRQLLIVCVCPAALPLPLLPFLIRCSSHLCQLSCAGRCRCDDLTALLADLAPLLPRVRRRLRLLSRHHRVRVAALAEHPHESHVSGALGHRSLPLDRPACGVLRLPPHRGGCGEGDVFSGELAIELHVPLCGDVREDNGEVIGGRHPLVRAEWADRA